MTRYLVLRPLQWAVLAHVGVSSTVHLQLKFIKLKKIRHLYILWNELNNFVGRVWLPVACAAGGIVGSGATRINDAPLPLSGDKCASVLASIKSLPMMALSNARRSSSGKQ